MFDILSFFFTCILAQTILAYKVFILNISVNFLDIYICIYIYNIFFIYFYICFEYIFDDDLYIFIYDLDIFLVIFDTYDLNITDFFGR